MLPATAAESVPEPSLLVVGFNVDMGLRARFKGIVCFVEDPASLSKPETIPAFTSEIWVRSGVDDPHKKRLENLSRAVNVVYESRISSLPDLRDRLEDKFPAPAQTPAPISDGLRIIRQLPVRPGSVVSWVQANMTYPCQAGPESKRLAQLAVSKKFEASESTIYQAVYSLLQRAGLAATSKTEIPEEVVANATASQIITSIQFLLEETAKYQANMSGQLRTIQVQIKRLEGESASYARMEAENVMLRREVETTRKQALKTQSLLDDIKKKLES